MLRQLISIFGRRSLSIALLLTTSTVAIAQNTPTLDRIKQSGVITIAHRESSLPFSYVDENKKPIGYALDICLKVVDAIQRELKLKVLKINWILVTSKNRIEIIQQGKADLECGSTTNNKERRETVAFSIPYYITGARILVKKSSGITSLEGLRDKTVVTTKGATSLKVIQAQNDQRVLKLKLVEADDHAQSFKMVEEGKADAFVMDDVLLFSLRAQAANPDNFDVVGEFMSIEPLAIMISKDDPAFKKIIDREVTRMIVDFEMQALYKKWFLEPIPPKGINLKMPMSYLLRDSFRFPTDKVND